MTSPDVLELATFIPLPKSTSNVHLTSVSQNSASTDGSLPNEPCVENAANAGTDVITSDAGHASADQAETDFNIDEDPNIPRLNESSLPPMDKGFGAWSYLVAAFLIETIVWGFPLAFGVFLEEYLNDPVYTSQPNAQFLLPLIGPISMGIIYCSSPILNPLLVIRYPYYRRAAMRFGVVLCAGSLIGASWATTVPQLLILQGIIYALGGALLWHPTLSYLPAWFFTRRGFANGVFFAGAAVGGVILPLLLPPLLQRYGTRVTLRYIGVAVGVGLFPAVLLIKPRVPERVGPRPRPRLTPESGLHGAQRLPMLEQMKENIKRRLSWWSTHSSFVVLLVANTVQAFGFFMPLIWLPTYASSLNLNKTESSLVLSLLHGGSFIGRLGLGFLSDKLDPWVLAVGTLVSTTLSVFILWGICSFNLAGLLAFGLVYGTFAGGWSTLFTGFVRGGVRERNEASGRTAGPDDPQVASTLLGYLTLTRGIGNVFSTPISSVLQPSSSSSGSNSGSASFASLINNTNTGAPFFATSNVDLQVPAAANTGFSVSNHRFQNLIIYVGTCFAAAAVVMLIGWGWEKWYLRSMRNEGSRERVRVRE